MSSPFLRQQRSHGAEWFQSILTSTSNGNEFTVTSLRARKVSCSEIPYSGIVIWSLVTEKP